MESSTLPTEATEPGPTSEQGSSEDGFSFAAVVTMFVLVMILYLLMVVAIVVCVWRCLGRERKGRSLEEEAGDAAEIAEVMTGEMKTKFESEDL